MLRIRAPISAISISGAPIPVPARWNTSTDSSQITSAPLPVNAISCIAEISRPDWAMKFVSLL
jgi:hypothetical protein